MDLATYQAAACRAGRMGALVEVEIECRIQPGRGGNLTTGRPPPSARAPGWRHIGAAPPAQARKDLSGLRAMDAEADARSLRFGRAPCRTRPTTKQLARALATAEPFAPFVASPRAQPSPWSAEPTIPVRPRTFSTSIRASKGGINLSNYRQPESSSETELNPVSGLNWLLQPPLSATARAPLLGVLYHRHCLRHHCHRTIALLIHSQSHHAVATGRHHAGAAGGETSGEARE